MGVIPEMQEEDLADSYSRQPRQDIVPQARGAPPGQLDDADPDDQPI